MGRHHAPILSDIILRRHQVWARVQGLDENFIGGGGERITIGGHSHKEIERRRETGWGNQTEKLSRTMLTHSRSALMLVIYYFA